jgi:hypothetical protein
LKAIYSTGQLDRPKGNVRVGRDGVLSGSPTGFPGPSGEKDHLNQMPEDRHGPRYTDDLPVKGWPHSAGDTGRRPAFDNRGSGHHFKNPNPSNATGKDATKSPFSKAHFKGNGER